jgi:hypothetical protein
MEGTKEKMGAGSSRKKNSKPSKSHLFDKVLLLP